MNKIILTTLLFTLYACSTSKITKTYGHRLAIYKNDVVLLRHTQHYSLVEPTKDVLKANGVKCIYLPEIEYDLLAKGILKDSLSRPIWSNRTNRLLKDQFGITHILAFELMGSSSATLYDFHDTELVRAGITNNSRSHSKANLNFRLNSTTDSNYVHLFNIETSINPLSWEKGNTQYSLNLSDDKIALLKAHKKGMKKIKKMITS